MLADITEALRRGDHAAALAAARAAVSAQPDHADAQHLLGVCLQRANDGAGARAAFERAIALSPDQAAYYYSLATLELAEGHAPAAIRGLQTALSLDPNQLGAYVMLLHLAMSRGDLAEAERQLRLAQRVNAEHPQVLVAEGYLAQAQGDGDRALRLFTDAAAVDPNLAAAQQALGKSYLSRGMWPFAEQAFANSLAMDPSRPVATLRGLVEARRRQGKAAETLEVLDELLAGQPDDLVGRGLRAEIRASQGQADSALADLLYLLDRVPTHVHTLNNAALLLAQSGRGPEALQRVEAALARAPQVEDLWRVRLNVSGILGENAKPLLDRWQAACPGSADALDMQAAYHQAQREDGQAEDFADRALALDPTRFNSTLVKVRLAMEDAPADALARVDALLATTEVPAQQRDLQGWAGLALDALGRHDEAGQRWREMVKRIPNQLPPPPVAPADQAPPGEGAGVLLWSPPGVRAEFILRTLQPQLGERLRTDRIGARESDDGFGRLRPAAGQPGAGSAARWRQALEAKSLDPATVADWLPHLDGYTLAALKGAKVLALLTDPRDAFLNWLVHGSLQDYLFSPEPRVSADWLAGSLEALADFRDLHPGNVLLARLDRDAGKAAATIEHALGVTEPLPALFGKGARFPVGHWRQFRSVFAEEFARLEAVSARLGYPAD